MSKYIGSKQFYKAVILIVLPIVGQQLVQASVNFIDNFMVAGLGEEAVAGVAIANQYYYLFLPVTWAVCAGTAIFIAQYFGGKRYDKLQATFGLSLVVPAVASVIYIVLGLIFMDEIIMFFNKDSLATIDYARQYMGVMIFSYLPLAIAQSFTFLFRPIGLAKIPFIFSSIALVINAILNYGLIYGKLFLPEMGVQGAALGTLIARVIQMLLLLLVFLKMDLPFKGQLKNYFNFNKELLSDAFRKIGALMVNELLFSVSFVLIFKAYTTRGIIAITALNVADVIFKYIVIFTNGTGTATSLLIGSKLGAGEFDEAEKNANHLFGYLVVLGLVMMVVLVGLAFIVPSFYSALSIETKELMKWMIIVYAITIPINMFFRLPYFALRSGGRMKEVLLIDAGFMWVVKIPVAIGLAYFTTLPIMVIFVCVESTRILNAIFALYFYRQRKWLNRFE